MASRVFLPIGEAVGFFFAARVGARCSHRAAKLPD